MPTGLFAIVFGVLVVGLSGAAWGQGAAPSTDGQGRYAACVAAASRTPETALDEALAWRDTGGGLPAEHCAALAQVALHRYQDAAERLDGLVAGIASGRYLPPGSAVNVEDMRLDLLTQAGNAWLLAGKADAAYRDLAEALADTAPAAPRYVELLIDRARALAAMREYAAALDDLNRAARQAPDRADIFAFRAAAWRALGKDDQAMKDAETALLLDPDNPAALLERGNLRRIAGDADGARADWRRILDLAPDTPAAESARANIQRLEVGDGDPAPGAKPDKSVK